MAKCLVTGGAGFIGSHIVAALVKRGDQVSVLDNFSSGFRHNLEACAEQVEVIDGDTRTLHIPQQDSYRTENGLLVRIQGPALHQLNRSLYESGETLGVQIHAHPTDAYHSETDDAFPIVTALGGISIVRNHVFNSGFGGITLCREFDGNVNVSGNLVIGSGREDIVISASSDPGSATVLTVDISLNELIGNASVGL